MHSNGQGGLPVPAADAIVVDGLSKIYQVPERGSITEKCCRRVFRDGVNAPDLAHHGQLVAIEIARELPAH